jgi:SSS family solute:Na+ symporter
MTLPTVAFLIVSLVIGLYASRRIKGSVRNYFVAGHVIPFWVLVLSMCGQALELGGTYDNTARAMATGFWDGAVLPLGIGTSLILIGMFFAKPLHAMHLLTLPDFYSRRFNTFSGTMVAILCLISFVILIAGNLAGMGILMELAVGLPPYVTVPIIALLIGSYTIAGGLFAVTWNDVLQCSVLFLGVAVALGALVTAAEPGTLSLAFNNRFSWAPLTSLEHGSLAVWAGFLALGIGDIVALDFMERVFSARTDRAAQSACYVAGVITIGIGVAMAMIGMIASTTAAGAAQGATLVEFVQNGMPASVKMLFVMALLAAGISTIDGAIMASTKALSRNILQTLMPSRIPDNRLLRVSRLMVTPITIAAVLLALVFPVPGELLVLAFDVVFAGCVVPLALGIYWKRGTGKAAVLAILIPSILRLALYFFYADLGLAPWLKGIDTLIPPVLSLMIFVGVSLYQREPEPASTASQPIGAV